MGGNRRKGSIRRGGEEGTGIGLLLQEGKKGGSGPGEKGDQKKEEEINTQPPSGRGKALVSKVRKKKETGEGGESKKGHCGGGGEKKIIEVGQ